MERTRSLGAAGGRWPFRGAEALAWTLVLVLAAALRLAGITKSLPYISYVDEGAVLHPALHIVRTRGWDPGTFLYPSLSYELVAAAVHAYRPAYRMRHGHSLLFDLPPEDGFYDDIRPPEVVVLGRLVVACFGIATVAVTGLLARALGGPLAGVLAALFAAACPALVFRSSIVIVDTLAAFFATAALLFAHLLIVRARAGLTGRGLGLPAFAAGAACGLAFTAKYTVVTVFAAVLLAVSWTGRSVAEKVRLAAAAAAGLLLAALATMPALVLRFGSVLSALRQQSWLYRNTASFDPYNADKSYLAQFLRPEEMGVPLAALALAGAISLVLRRGTRRTALAFLGFAVALLTPLLGHSYRPVRNLLPLVPMLCAAAAVLVASAWGAPRARWIALAAAAGVVASLAMPALRIVRERRTLVDTRVAVVNLLAAHLSAGQRVLVERELAILPSELARIPASVRVATFREIPAVLRAATFDYVVAGRLDLFGSLEPSLVADRDAWHAWLRTAPVAAHVGSAPTPIHPNYWRSSYELIFVLRPPP